MSNKFENTDLFDDIVDVPVNQQSMNQEANTANTLKKASVSKKTIINHKPNTANTANTEKNGNVIKFTAAETTKTTAIANIDIKYDADTDMGVI